MIYAFLEISTVVLECLMVHVLFNGWFGLKHRKRVTQLLFYLPYFAMNCLVTLLPLYPVLRSVICCIFAIIISKALYDTTIFSAAFSSVLFMVLAVLSEYLSLMLLVALNVETHALEAGGNARAIYLVLAKITHFAVVLVVTSVFRKNRAALSVKQIVPLLSCLAVVMYICTVFYRVYSENHENLSLVLFIALVGLLYINGLIVFYTQLIKSTVAKNEEQKQAVLQYGMQEQYYKNVIRDREETLSVWHDIKKHMTAIEAIVSSGDSITAKEEYREMHHAFSKIGDIVNVENEVINTILYHNIQNAKAQGIPVHLSAHIPPEILVSAVDLSVIIGNTFDNAIDECILLESERREISVTLIQQNKMLFYEIRNPCSDKAPEKSGRHHGYGLKNVMTCVEKYTGTMENGISEGQYVISVRLNCK